MMESMRQLTLLAYLFSLSSGQSCSSDLMQMCASCCDASRTEQYNCSLPGLDLMTPGKFEGVTANYLSFATETSSPNLPIRAKEFKACTGGTIVFSEAANVWEDPIQDLGTKTSRGSEVYDGYFMSYSHFPEAAALDLAENLNERIRSDNARLKWEDVLPKVRTMGEYRKDGKTNIDFLMYDGDFFVPIIRLDLLEKHALPLPNTWEEVVELAKFFNGTDLNDDGDPNDFGFCHFPRLGAGYWDWWWPEALYSTWATYEQTEGSKDGFFFDIDTMEPRTGAGFQQAAETWKELWTNGADGCITDNFVTGRCAIGFSPPGCWKGVFLNPDGVSRKDENGTVIWRPTMKSGEYAEPYRFKPFGSTRVLDKSTGEMATCTEELCPKAEPIPPRGHVSDDDRASILPPSPLEGQLVNRAPFYWSGGLGTLIRKSSTEEKKNLIWDFFVYTNSPETSVHDVANYASWLDSWRISQLEPGKNFLGAGWSQQAYEEHASVMKWALSAEVNGALNLRIPGLVKYTRDTVGQLMTKFIQDEISLDQLSRDVATGWNEINLQEGKLDQLEIYRAALGLDAKSEVELCRLHRELMDEKDPSICRAYDVQDLSSSVSVLLPAILVPSFFVLAAVAAVYIMNKRRKASDAVWEIKPSELQFLDPPEILGRGTFGLVLLGEYRGTQVAVKRVIPPKEKVGVAEVDSNELIKGSLDGTLMDRTKGSADLGSLELAEESTNQVSSQKKKSEKLAIARRSWSFIGSSNVEESKQQNRTSRTRRSSMDNDIDAKYTNDLPGHRSTAADTVRRLSLTNKTKMQESEHKRRASMEEYFDVKVTGDLPGHKSTFADSARIVSAEYSDRSLDLEENRQGSTWETSARDESMNNGSMTISRDSTDFTFNESTECKGRLAAASSLLTRSFKSPEYKLLKADFIEEMRYISKLRHPCITTVMGAVITKRADPMLVMEFMEYGSLYDILHNETVPLDGEILLPMLQDISRGMRFLHAATPKVIHGDLKAHNVLVDSKFRAKVADFGLSAKKTVGATGTPLWMAPELLRGESGNTSASDVYSFGIILYEVYSRKDPYEGENVKRVLSEVADPNIQKRPPVPKACPSNVAALMTDSLNEDPELRPAFHEIDLRLKRLHSENAEPGESCLSRHARKLARASRSENLLYEVFPKHVAAALREGRKVEPEKREIVTVFFSDIVGFTNISATISDEKVSNMLDRLYVRLDDLSHKHDVFKIETIGDAYLCVTNLVKPQDEDHAKRIALFAIDAIKAASEVLVNVDDPSMGYVQIRIGFHSGPVVAQVVGTRLPKYSMFGDTVNTASRMESTSLPGKIQCSERSAKILRKQCPEIQLFSRGCINVKGKGGMDTFFVKPPKANNQPGSTI